MVPMHAKKRKGAFNEPHEFRVHAPIESGGAPPHSRTLARWPQSLELPPGFGVRRRCGALDFPGTFRVPMHGIKVVGALHALFNPAQPEPNKLLTARRCVALSLGRFWE